MHETNTPALFSMRTISRLCFHDHGFFVHSCDIQRFWSRFEFPITDWHVQADCFMRLVQEIGNFAFLSFSRTGSSFELVSAIAKFGTN